MKSFGCKEYKNKIGIVLAQLGTPAAPTSKALRTYLRQFLSDPRVIEVNRFVWWFILNAIVLRTRPKRSAALYKRIWTKEGSPLLLTSISQATLLQQRLRTEGIEVEIEVGMRYGEPSTERALDSLMQKGCARILILPMYPQYCAATTGSTTDAVFKHLCTKRWVPTLRVAEPYFVNRNYIEALAHTINTEISRIVHETSENIDHLILSYHGIPESYIKKGDPYCCMCSETTQALIPKLSLKPKQVIHCFQSRFGKDPWLTPYTDETIKNLAMSGSKSIAVACPGFTTDCLETIDEIGHEAKELFQANGGSRLHLIPCLNDRPVWIQALTDLVKLELGSWLIDSSIQSDLIQCPTNSDKVANLG